MRSWGTEEGPAKPIWRLWGAQLFALIHMAARRGVQLLAPLTRAFAPVQHCTPAVRSLPCVQLPLRCFASDADLKKTPLYDFHVEHGGGDPTPDPLDKSVPTWQLLALQTMLIHCFSV